MLKVRKEKSVKYSEAVARNLRNAKKEKYAGKGIDSAKRSLGIKTNDSSYDDAVEKLIKKG